MISVNTSYVLGLLVCGITNHSLATNVRCDIDGVIQRMDQLEKENARLASGYVQMKRQNEFLVSRVYKLEEEIKEQRVTDDQCVTVKELRYVIDEQERTFQNFMTNNTVQNGNKRRRSFPEVPYAFSAVLDHNVEHSGIDQPVVFNHALLNDGNAYNSHTGIFTVPTEGVYLFYLAFATGYAPHQLWMHIVVDGVGQVAGAADNLQSAHDAQGTNLVMLHLHQGDSVWVSTFAFPDVKIYGSKLFTTFSGVLLYQY